MKHKFLLIISFLFLLSCSNSEEENIDPVPDEKDLVAAMDISTLPEIETTNPQFYDAQNNPEDFLQIIKESGVNTIRLRLWVDPENEHSGFNEVTQFAQTLKFG